MRQQEKQCEEQVRPLLTLADLLTWQPSAVLLELISESQLHPLERKASAETHFSTLVCHDMKGGYLDDRFCHGTCNREAYNFVNWWYIDIFVYFSHCFITIPPIGWIKAAHLHEVKILGTIITEWDEGKDLCSAMLASESSINETVHKLVQVADFYKFDGYLFNIENEIHHDQIGNLLEFITRLTAEMKKISSESVVIWYDSITREGKLDWQNELNDSNRCFFDACDGIFINYTWTPEHLSRSQSTACERKRDVYIGVDVYGRNFYRGGGFNCDKALEVIRENGLSVAIFGQGWVYEVLGAAEFWNNDRDFWQRLYPFLHCHSLSVLPVTTSFCTGSGCKVSEQAEVTRDQPWFNLCRQQLQPIYSKGKDFQLGITFDDAFHGGSCLTVWAGRLVDVSLWKCHFEVAGLSVEVALKRRSAPVDIHLIFYFICRGEKRSAVLELDKNKESSVTEEGVVQATSSKVINSWILRNFSVSFMEQEPVTVEKVTLQVSGPCVLFLGFLSLKEM